MKIQSTLIATYSFLLSVVLAASYPTTIEFGGMGHDANGATLRFTDYTKILHARFSSAFTVKALSSSGTVETDNMDNLIGNYNLTLSSTLQTLQITGESKEGASFVYSGPTVVEKPIEELSGVAYVETFQ
ncbi:hypothetical protein DFQ30_005549 [Apophysomyces sp. BC1015]|nr:hypothetical protein DFQ30_005549 [Apophysomyces sp. BC1015]KAG0177716.1 hypothetical protein DFQ29_004508 [Apophysomyces sp. BC1021]